MNIDDFWCRAFLAEMNGTCSRTAMNWDHERAAERFVKAADAATRAANAQGRLDPRPSGARRLVDEEAPQASAAPTLERVEFTPRSTGDGHWDLYVPMFGGVIRVLSGCELAGANGALFRIKWAESMPPKPIEVWIERSAQAAGPAVALSDDDQAPPLDAFCVDTRPRRYHPGVTQAAMDSLSGASDADLRIAVELGHQADVEPKGPRREIMRIASDRLRSYAAQPRDLAGRIRALVMQKAGEWADASGGDRTAHHDALCDLRRALEDVRTGLDIHARVEMMRNSFRADYPEHRIRLRQAADELEAIVRECGER